MSNYVTVSTLYVLHTAYEGLCDQIFCNQLLIDTVTYNQFAYSEIIIDAVGAHSCVDTSSEIH